MTDTPTECDTQSLLDSVSNAIYRISPEPHGDDFEHFEIKQLPLAKLRIYSIESDPFTVHRRPQDIVDDSIFDFFIHTHLEGTAEVEQGEARFTLEPGALAVVSGGVPYSIKYNQKGSRIIMRIPHRIFHERILGRKLCEFGAQIFRGEGLVQIVVDLMKSLNREMNHLTDTESYSVAESILDLVGLVCRSHSKLDAINHGSAQAARMCRILSFLEENYTDHELTPAKIADANAVSMRHLHNLFRQSGLTVCKWIWERRLKATREDLLDPAKVGASISEIAYEKGFNDSSHFSRAFKERFGISPSGLRGKLLEQQQVTEEK